MSRAIADSGRYPAIDVEASISRVMVDIVSKEQTLMARQFKQLYSSYHQNHDLIAVGAYRKGSDPSIDKAIEKYPQLTQFLSQEIKEHFSLETTLAALKKTVT